MARAIVLIVAALALVSAQDWTKLQWPQYLATFDCGVPLYTGGVSSATSIAALTASMGTTGVCASSGAALTGSQAACFVNWDANTGLATLNMTYQGVPSKWTAAHLHGEPEANPIPARGLLYPENPVIGGTGTTWMNVSQGCETQNGPNGLGSVPGGGCGMSMAAQVLGPNQRAAIMNPGMYNMNYYCNIHTSAAGSGELRGHIYAATNRYMAACDGAQAGVASTNGMCTAWCTVSQTNGGTLSCGGMWWNLLLNVTAMHVHAPAVQGAASGVWVVLNPTQTMWNPMWNMWGSFSGTDVNKMVNGWDAIVALRSDMAYVNIHTSGVGAGGEVRGQLRMVNSDPAAFVPGAAVFYESSSCQAVGNTGMYWQGCAKVSNMDWSLTEYTAMYSDSACTNMVSAKTVWSTLFNLGVHKLWAGMDITRHNPSKVSAMSNSADDIAAWNSGCACGGTWVAGVTRANLAGCTCSLLNTNWHAGVFNASGYWFGPAMGSASAVFMNSNITTSWSWINSYSTVDEDFDGQCTDYTSQLGAASSVVSSSVVVAIAAVIAFIAARDV